jgi:hypothetical protein
MNSQKMYQIIVFYQKCAYYDVSSFVYKSVDILKTNNAYFFILLNQQLNDQVFSKFDDDSKLIHAYFYIVVFILIYNNGMRQLLLSIILHEENYILKMALHFPFK